MLAAQPGGRVERAACSERATCRSPPCHSPQAHRNTLGPLAFASIMPRVLRMPPPTCCDSVEAGGWVGSTSAARASMQGDQHASVIVLIWAHKERCQAARRAAARLPPCCLPPLTLTFFFLRPLVGPSSASAHTGTMLASALKQPHHGQGFKAAGACAGSTAVVAPAPASTDHSKYVPREYSTAHRQSRITRPPPCSSHLSPRRPAARTPHRPTPPQSLPPCGCPAPGQPAAPG